MSQFSTDQSSGCERIKRGIAKGKALPMLPAIDYGSRASHGALPTHYKNQDARLGIDFQVAKFPFVQLQAMDARLVTIAPGASNEKHRHAHESIFVVLEGEAVLHIEGEELPLAQGDLAYVPRWAVHQTRNRSSDCLLRLLAITDFALTSSLLGDYDRQTRLKEKGCQVSP
jgi:quercetin dioxygenase-like cupin family protein